MAVDLKRTVPGYRARRGTFALVEVPPLTFLALDGHGDPNTAPAYADALASLYPLAYGLRFRGRALGHDHPVMPLEALWWADDPAAFTSARDKARWSWTVLILVPGWVTAEHLEAVRPGAVRRGAPRADAVRLETLHEGLCVQTLHVGPYDEEGPVLATLHEEWLPAHGLTMTGRHHEVYLNDARRTAPGRLRTILRQPVVPTET